MARGRMIAGAGCQAANAAWPACRSAPAPKRKGFQLLVEHGRRLLVFPPSADSGMSSERIAPMNNDQDRRQQQGGQQDQQRQQQQQEQREQRDRQQQQGGQGQDRQREQR